MKKLGLLAGMLIACCMALVPAQSFASPLAGFGQPAVVTDAPDFVLPARAVPVLEVAALEHERPSKVTDCAVGAGSSNTDVSGKWPDGTGIYAAATFDSYSSTTDAVTRKPEVGWRA